jgi:hypothetical protein
MQQVVELLEVQLTHVKTSFPAHSKPSAQSSDSQFSIGTFKSVMKLSPPKKSQVLSLTTFRDMILAGTVDGHIYAWSRDVSMINNK